MNTRRKMDVWRYGLMLALLCICSIPHLAGAVALVPQVPTGPKDVNGNWAVPDYYTTANWANSPQLAKFVDKLPGLGSAKANDAGQYLTVAKPDTLTYPGSDYYEIELVEFRQQLHPDLPLTTGPTTGATTGTLLRGYRQVNNGTNLVAGTLPSAGICSGPCTNSVTPDPVRYLGPTIISERDRPVRIKFTNKLPTGEAGNLFIPVDTTVMGAGEGPIAGKSYTQNRATIHLHGGRTPWISDGTPHQWITPAGELTDYAQGVSVQNVPDMPQSSPGDGSTTYYYTNQQSARLMFYHDHAFGITRLNVYAGEAAGYLITDPYEQDLVARNLIPGDQIPLIIQDKTFVNDTEIRKYDPLWNWGSGAADPVTGIRPPVKGDLWMPHVYMPAQSTVAGMGGVNPFGRWMYGPWFYPATVVTNGPVANPYYNPDCSSPFPAVYATCDTPGQPEQIPGTPHPSMGMEAFQDSVVVNGAAFPSLTVEPRAYRFRILNAASDRFQNLSFYVADTALDNISPDPRLDSTKSQYLPGRSNQTEVKMVPASVTAGWPALWPTDGRDGGVPDPGAFNATTGRYDNWGPSFLQIGNESGFLPMPVTIDPQPITYNTDPTAFWVGTVDKMGLALGPAERADVIVDFSAYAGKTLILYNDAPAAWPARVAGYDYFTGALDMRDSGGFGAGGVFDPASGVYVVNPADPLDVPHGILPGYAPNTRTVMQVIVSGGTAVPFVKAPLVAEFTKDAVPTGPTGLNPIIPGSNPPRAKTLFERAQEPIIVGQKAYASAYPDSYFPPNFPWEGINQINDHFLQFVTLAGQPVRISTEPKGIHDEMGASFDPVYGRMSGNLGMQLPNPTTLNALLVLYGFSDLPTETVNNSPTVNVQVLGSGTDPLPWSVTDGTQIWKISHNGVDTHPIHFHIFDVQLINRVGWDGQILLPEPNELGWKEVVKISPLEDTIVAVRPRAPLLPFGISNSLRPLNPAIPLGSSMGFNSVNWQTGQVDAVVTNKMFDFGWEYVWHCHILSHEEMDMMRPIVLKVPSTVPDAPVLSSPSVDSAQVQLSWTDLTLVNYVTGAGFGDTKNEIGFRVQRCTGATCTDFATIGATLANKTTYSDSTAVQGVYYRYRVLAYNAAGSAASSILTTLRLATNGNGAIVINGNATYTVSSAAVLTLNASASGFAGATQMRFSKDGGLTWVTGWETYSTTRSVTLLAGNGPRSMTVQFRNGSGTVSSVYADTIIVDSVKPTGTVQINGGAVITNSVNATLTLSASDANVVTQMRFSKDNVTWFAWEAYATTRSITLLANGAIYVQFMDGAGNQSSTASDTIILDTTAPTGSIQINGGAVAAATTTTSSTVTLTLAAADANGVTQMQFSKDGGLTWFLWEAFVTPRVVTLTPGLGLRTIDVRYKDTAGNVSPKYQTSITRL